jgi:arsenate reductase (glutaredoxin)
MKKVYFLPSCSTCTKIIKHLKLSDNFEMIDIKTTQITAEELAQMKELSGSYESLFSRRALKYKALGLKDKTLTEDDFKKYILEEYTFLKRPVILFEDQIFVGNAAKNVAAADAAING